VVESSLLECIKLVKADQPDAGRRSQFCSWLQHYTTAERKQLERDRTSNKEVRLRRASRERVSSRGVIVP